MGNGKRRHIQQRKAEQLLFAPSPCGQFMLLVSQCAAGYGEASTATFIRSHAGLLRGEIRAARALWVRTKRLNGRAPTPEMFLQQFPEIASCCSAQDVETYIGDAKRRTPRTAALEILHRFFPGYTDGSIERMSRMQVRRSSRMFSRFQVGKAEKARQSADTPAPENF
jgi:hypothetical protein